MNVLLTREKKEMVKATMLLKDAILIRLAYLNSVYRNDLSLLLSDQNNHETRIIDALIKDGLISEREIDKEYIYRSLANKKVKIIDITNRGRVYLADKFHNEKYVQLGLEVASKYRTSNIKKLHRLLADNRIRLMFYKVGVSVFDGKPSISEIRSMRDSDEIRKGVYYTREEFDDYSNKNDEGINDTYLGARFRGVFINQEQVCMVYLPNIEKNRVMKLSVAVENRAFGRVKEAFQYLTYQSSPNAIVFSNTDSLMYNMAICGHNGHNAHDYKEKKIGEYFFLNSNCDLFQHIYVFPHTFSGMDSLEKLCHSDHLGFQQESCEIFSSLENFKAAGAKNLDLFYGYNIVNQEMAVYIPYYDIKLFSKIYRLEENSITVVTFDDMADNIAHAIRKPAHYFNLEGDFIPVKQYLPSGDAVNANTIKTRENRYKPRKIKHTVYITKKTSDMLMQEAKKSYSSVSSLLEKIINDYFDKNTIGEQNETNGNN